MACLVWLAAATPAFATEATTSTNVSPSDPAVVYTGSWSFNASPAFEYTNTQGAVATIHFTGTGIRVNMASTPTTGPANFSLDGGGYTVPTILNGPSNATTLVHNLFEVFGLADGPHTLTITEPGQQYIAFAGATVYHTVITPDNLPTVTISIEGDSTCSLPLNWVERISHFWEAGHPQAHLHFVNHAAPDRTLNQMLGSVSTELVADDPDIFIVCSSLNDGPTFEKDAGVTSQALMKEVIRAVQSYQNSHKVAPVCVVGTDNISDAGRTQADMVGVAAAYMDAANAANCPSFDLTSSWIAAVGWGTPASYAELQDMVHPNVDGDDQLDIPVIIPALTSAVYTALVRDGYTISEPPPGAPVNLKAIPGDAQITLSWSPVSGATSYNLYRGTSAGGEAVSPHKSGLTSATFTDTSVVNGTAYYYVVTAIGHGGEGLASNEATATPEPSTPPLAPTFLVATAGNNQVQLSWTGVLNTASYNVKRSTVTGGPYTTVSTPAGSVTGTGYTDKGVTNGTTYYYVVTAVNVAGEGPASNEANATPTTPRINAGGGAYSSTTLGTFQADTAYTGGGTWSFYGLNITGTNDPELYRTVRYSASSFSYALPAAPGSYTLRLHFVEGDAHALTPGFRTFNVLVNDRAALSNFDVAAAAGGLGRALDESLPVTVPSGSGGVTVTFQTVRYGAMVSALELVPASSP